MVFDCLLKIFLINMFVLQSEDGYRMRDLDIFANLLMDIANMIHSLGGNIEVDR